MTETQDTKAVTVPPKTDASMAVYDYGEAAGAGFEDATADDYAIPFLGILQAQSPQVLKAKPEFIEGASAGSLFNTVTGELFDGDKGVVIVPLSRQYVTVEWTPRDKGGGMVAMHDPKSSFVTEIKQKSEFGDWKTENGNDLIDTFYLYALPLDSAEAKEPSGMPMVIAFTSTKIKKYKQAMSKWRAIKGSPPLYAFRVLLKTVPDNNPKGDFFNFNLSPAVGETYVDSLLPPDHPVYITGAEFMEKIKSGLMKPDVSSQTAEAAPSAF